MDNINDILASLSADDINALKETAEAIFGSNRAEAPPQSPKQTDGVDFSKLDPGIFMKISSIMSAINSDGGKRCQFIQALKPNLSPPRQKKADEAMQLLKLMEIMPLLGDFMKRDD